MAKRRLININDSVFERAHLSRIENYAEQVKSVYTTAINEYVKLGVTVKDFNPDKLFSFKDYPQTREKVDRILKSTYQNVLGIVRNGIDKEWKHAGTKNDKLVESLLSTSKLSLKQINKYSNRNLDALSEFQKRKDGKDRLGLSERIWKIAKDHKQEIELGLDIGLGEGKSAAAISQIIRKNLEQPDNLFRRVRNKRGTLIPSSVAESFNPGSGVYRSSFKNAMRVTRTETNMAYRASDHERWGQLDFVVGIEIRLSNNPNHCPMCEALAGKYPKDFKFVGWHPQCRCHAISILKTAEEFDRDEKVMLDGETPDGKSKNTVSDVPDKFKEWVNTNKGRATNAKSTPFWIKDNFKNGDINKGLAFSTKKQTSAAAKVTKTKTAKPETKTKGILNLADFIKGNVPTNKEAENIMLAFAANTPENFRTGLGSLRFRQSRSYMMQHSASYKTSTNQWVGKADITISKNNFLSIGFNPESEFKGALSAIKNGQELTFNQEYSLESMWHEILHAKTLSPPQHLTVGQTKAMETVNQFVARHTYDEFVNALGGKVSHKNQILEKGYGYSNWITDFRNKLKLAGISEQTALAELQPVLMKNYKNIEFELIKFFAKNKKP
ncbi:hypothetical protein [Pedobacter sp. Leaf132]|uniref:hypothetical protein n=1 Tax=Pedobacter sp. Leaf132 TaxID=2876557 RepID=UPI001E534B08|nr:hypothetical protein [Pedobacter sp. Leaf132]